MKDNISKENLAYIAGLFDGEGSISAYFQYTKTSIAVKQCFLSNTNENILEWLQDTLGVGRLYAKKLTRTKPMHDWAISNEADLCSFLNLIKPWVRIKAVEIDLILALVSIGQARRASKGDTSLMRTEKFLVDTLHNMHGRKSKHERLIEED